MTDALLMVGIAFKQAQSAKMMGLLPLAFSPHDWSSLLLLGAVGMAIWAYKVLEKKKEIRWISDSDLGDYNEFIHQSLKGLPVPKEGEIYHDAPEPFVMVGAHYLPIGNCKLIVLSKRPKRQWKKLFENNLMENGIMLIIEGHEDKDYRIVECIRKKSYYNRDW